MSRWCAGSMGLVVALIAVSVQAMSYIPYRTCFHKSADKHEVAVDLVLAVAATESNWNVNARSHANAHGLMQIQWPGTARHLGVRRIAQLYDPCLNIDLGARYLRELLDRFDGNESRALAAYNYGPSRIEKAEVLPAGAKKYVATVARHRQRLKQGSVSKSLKPREKLKEKRVRTGKPASNLAYGKRDVVMVVSSRFTAQRYAEMLSEKIRGATFKSVRTADSRYAVVVELKRSGLTADDRVVLSAFGWPSG